MKNIQGGSQGKRIGIAADHGGFELKEFLRVRLGESGFEVFDFGNDRADPSDDFPDYVVPLAHAVADGKVERGIALCGSGVGACIAANKISGVRAGMITETFSAHQGVEDDNMNMICMGGRVTGHEMAWEIVTSFLQADFLGEERFLRRLKKITELEL